MSTGTIESVGELRLSVTRTQSPRPRPWAKWLAIRRWKVRHFFVQRWREYPLEVLLAITWLLARIVPGFNRPMHGRLYMKVIRPDGEVWDYGYVGCHLVTTAGKGAIVDAFQDLVELETFKYHGLGTGTTAAAVGDTALQTELTTQYGTDNTRATGTTTEASATVFRTVATNTLDASAAITEWGLLSQAAVAGGTLMDRQVFSAINLGDGDSIQTTYDLTIS